MAQRDRAAAGVDLRGIGLGLLEPRHDDGREGLVDLDGVDVVDRQPRLLKRVVGCRDGPRQHEYRVGTACADVVDTGARLEPQSVIDRKMDADAALLFPQIEEFLQRFAEQAIAMR